MAIQLPVEYLICRLKRPHSDNHLTDLQKEVNRAYRKLAEKQKKRCIQKLQPFYKVGSLTADNFYISGQFLAGKHFDGIKHLNPTYKYSISNLEPEATKARADLISFALEPWIRLFIVALEILECPNYVLTTYLSEAMRTVDDVEKILKAHKSLNASLSGTKKRTAEKSTLDKKIVLLYCEGTLQNAIALELDTSESTVSRAIKKLNIARNLDVKPH